MRRLSLILIPAIVLLFMSVALVINSPHGDDFSISCDQCHNTDTWKFDQKNHSFNHDSTVFPLLGLHKGINCRLCHESLIFNQAKSQCVECHTDMHYGTVGNDCERCHSPNSWVVQNITELHMRSRFPLLGAHILADCQQCHPSESELRFEPLSIECFGCHAEDYSSAQEPNHVAGNYSKNCTDCHLLTAFTWSGAGVDHSFFPLTGGHQLNDCFECHRTPGIYSNLSKECNSCHETDFNSATNPPHDAVNFSTNCTLCHTTNPGWSPATFEVHNSIYPLTGAHLTTDCASCHQGNYSTTPNTCESCHINSFNETTNPNHITATFPTDCSICHTTTQGWKPAGFTDHDAQFFPIYSGKHGGEWTNCNECHTNAGNFSLFSCTDCHEHNIPDMNDEHQGVQGYSSNSLACYQCHPTGDEGGGFNHSLTNFPLTGAHLTAECLSCHTNGFEGTTMVCNDCHNADYTQSANPSHTGLGLSTDCNSCHTTNSGWQPATFPVHGNYFPLSGAHLSESCASCHNGNYTNTPNTCQGCHINNYNQTTNPNHASAGISTDCVSCHTTNPDWQPATFTVHNNYYPLTGAHSSSDCASCHNGNYTNTPNTCQGCHINNYNQTTNPNHASAGISTDCVSCHTTNPDWQPATFTVHNNYYPLTGAHSSSDCASCHNGNYTNTPNTCQGCHINNYNQTTNPNHVSAGISTDCVSCHTTNPDWQPALFTIHDNYYPLTGAHTSTDCASCHNGNYTNTPNTCQGCHINNYNQTTNPNHASAGISTDCGSCHSTNPDWQPASFTIHDNYYPLTGAHTSTDCASCHNGNYTNTPNTCEGCHINNYNQTTNPNHAEAGISTDCVSCHITNPDWQPATFFIHNNYYPLTGAHTSTDCASCHNGNYTNTPNTCEGCHINNYNQTTNPNHAEAGISTDCVSCHSTNPDWQPATFTIHNNYYPLTGAHTSTDCASCHNGNYTNTPNTCEGCHINNYNQTTNPNHAAAGISTDCVSCHTTNPDWQPALFTIHDNYYPLTGAHTSTDCASCHNGNYTNTPNTCVGCHINNYNQATNPSHINLGLPTECTSCHTTNPNWEPATFSIHNNYFILVGAHAVIANNCDLCHQGNYNNTPNTCVGCHLQDYNQTNDPPHASAQFPTTCELCHSQNAWVPSSFNHDAQYFPIYSGEHEGEWETCSDCHTNSGNYAIFSCFGCHPQGEMNDEHQGVPGYVYNSDACYQCHPDGGGGFINKRNRSKR